MNEKQNKYKLKVTVKVLAKTRFVGGFQILHSVFCGNSNIIPPQIKVVVTVKLHTCNTC